MNKIECMVDLRQYATSAALDKLIGKPFTTKDLIETAQSIESYILGNAKLPEVKEDLQPLLQETLTNLTRIAKMESDRHEQLNPTIALYGTKSND